MRGTVTFHDRPARSHLSTPQTSSFAAYLTGALHLLRRVSSMQVPRWSCAANRQTYPNSCQLSTPLKALAASRVWTTFETPPRPVRAWERTNPRRAYHLAYCPNYSHVHANDWDLVSAAAFDFWAHNFSVYQSTIIPNRWSLLGIMWYCCEISRPQASKHFFPAKVNPQLNH